MKNTRNLGIASGTSHLPNHWNSGRGWVKCAALARAVSNFRCLAIPLHLALALLLVVSVSGCLERLAQKDAYFASTNEVKAKARVQTERLIIHHRAVQVAQRGCFSRGPSSGAHSSRPPAPAGAPLRAAWTEDEWVALCGAPQGAYAADGAPSNAYRRWVEDQVRELPEPSDTASSVGGD